MHFFIFSVKMDFNITGPSCVSNGFNCESESEIDSESGLNSGTVDKL